MKTAIAEAVTYGGKKKGLLIQGSGNITKMEDHQTEVVVVQHGGWRSWV